MQFIRRYWFLIAIFLWWLLSDLLPVPPPDDSYIESLLTKGKTAEALQWAQEATTTKKWRTIFEFENPESIEIIETLYKFGAVRVTAIDIESDPEYGETTNMLIVELPESRTQRKELFDFAGRQARRSGFRPTADQGQRLLILYWS